MSHSRGCGAASSSPAGHASPPSTNTPAWKVLIFLRDDCGTPGSEGRVCDPAQSARTLGEGGSPLRGTGNSVYADFTMRDPQNWIVREEEFFPTLDVPRSHRHDPSTRTSLRAGYGDYMQPPPPEKRYNHEAAIIDLGPYADSL